MIETTYWAGDFIFPGLAIIAFILLIILALASLALESVGPGIVGVILLVVAVFIGVAHAADTKDAMIENLNAHGYTQVTVLHDHRFFARHDGQFGAFYMSQAGDNRYEILEIKK